MYLWPIRCLTRRAASVPLPSSSTSDDNCSHFTCVLLPDTVYWRNRRNLVLPRSLDHSIMSLMTGIHLNNRNSTISVISGANNGISSDSVSYFDDATAINCGVSRQCRNQHPIPPFLSGLANHIIIISKSPLPEITPRETMSWTIRTSTAH